MHSKSRYTIKEIAELAGVSRGTVDRVLYGRGKVSQKTYEKVKQILEQIDFKPNLAAQTLRKGELTKIAAIIPNGEFDPYWQRAISGIKQSIEEYANLGITIDLYLYNSFKELSFTYNASQVIKNNYNGIVLAPIFYKEAIQLLSESTKLEIPVVSFNTHIKSNNILCHVGQDLTKSGETVASLMHKILGEDNEYLIVHIDEDTNNAKHLEEKESGFRNYFNLQTKNNSTIKTIKIENRSQLELKLLPLLQNTISPKGIFVSTSKVHYVADLIEAYQLNHLLIGYDLIDENRAQLKKNNIDFLIFQNPALQANKALSFLIDHLAFKKEIPTQYLLPIEIVIKENYQDFR